MKKSPIYPHLLFILAAFAILFPNFAEYLVGFLILCWLLYGGKWWKNDQKWAENDRLLAEKLSVAIRPVNYGVVGLILCSAISAVGAWYFSPYSADFDIVARKFSHFFLKQCFLWFVLSGGMIAAIRRGWDHRSIALPFLVLLFVHFVYCLFQRYTGIDVTHGLGAVLPPNRFSYGVFRVSGAMGHPLTLAYNLMIIVLTAAAILFRSNELLTKTQRMVIFSITTLAMVTLLISGSRFPPVVAVLVIAICEWRFFWQMKYKVLAGVIFLSGLLWIEGSIIGRFSEVFLKNIPLVQQFPRLSFWQVHINMFLDNPIFGVGTAGYDEAAVHYYNLAGYHDKIYTAHNIYFQNLADSGVVGFLGLTSLFCGLFVAAFRLCKSRVKQGLMFLVMGTLVSGVMQNNLRDSEFLYAFWFCILILLLRSCLSQENEASL